MKIPTPVLVVLLIIFLCSFLWIEQITRTVIQASDVRIIGISVLSPGFRLFLGLGVVILEFVVVFVSMLDRVGDAIKAVLKPIATLLPLGAFVFTSLRTFLPVFGSWLPTEVTANMGISASDVDLAAAVNSGAFAINVSLTFITMLLFTVIASALARPSDLSRELRRLREENEKIRKLL